jgi:hypothetical protein
VLRPTDDFVLRANNVLLRTVVHRRIRADLHRRLRPRVLHLLCAELFELLRANLHDGLQRWLVSRLLVGSLHLERLGYANNVCRLVPSDLCGRLRTNLLCRLRSELLKLFDVRILRTDLLDLHRELCPGMQHVRYELRHVVRSGVQHMFGLQQLRLDLPIQLRLCGHCRSCPSFLPSSSNDLSGSCGCSRLLELPSQCRSCTGANGCPSADDRCSAANASSFYLRNPANSGDRYADCRRSEASPAGPASATNDNYKSPERCDDAKHGSA